MPPTRRARLAAAARWGCTVASIVTLMVWIGGAFCVLVGTYRSASASYLCGCGMGVAHIEKAGTSCGTWSRSRGGG
jgi:hypothetical protein